MATEAQGVFCQVCGKAQQIDTRYCTWCGAHLVPLTDKAGRPPLDPAAGRNKEGIGIVLFLLNIITYHYYSHYWGTVAMVFSALIWAWGRSENWYKNRVRPDDSPEIRTAKRLLRVRMTRQGAGFLLFILGAFVFYKYHRLVGGIMAGTGIFFGFYELWLRLGRRIYPS
ncbi:MAG: hypothetical protein HYX75_02760 [Acidobacteria bacterium]|nr:hypothetical protein [Acidobacteriota bacterium]